MTSWLFNPPEPNAEPTAAGVLSQDQGATDFAPAVPPIWSLDVNLVPPDAQISITQSGRDVIITFDRSASGGTFGLFFNGVPTPGISGRYDFGGFPALTVTAQEIEDQINDVLGREFGFATPLFNYAGSPAWLSFALVSVSGTWPTFTITQPPEITTLLTHRPTGQTFQNPNVFYYGSPIWSASDHLDYADKSFLFFPNADGITYMQRDLQIGAVTPPTENLSAEGWAIFTDRFYSQVGSLAIWREFAAATDVDDDYRWQLMFGVNYGTELPGFGDPSSWSLLFGPYIRRPGFSPPYAVWFAEDATGVPTQFPGLSPWRFSQKLVTAGADVLFAEFPDSINVHPAWW